MATLDDLLKINGVVAAGQFAADGELVRSEEHTSELQSRLHLVCRLLLEKKNVELVWPLIADRASQPQFYKGILSVRVPAHSADVAARARTLAFRHALRREHASHYAPLR